MSPNIPSGNRAMSKLVLSANGLLSKESGKVLAEMLKHNSVLQELDVSDNYMSTPSSITDGPGFAQELAVGLSDNGALSKLDLSMNAIFAAAENPDILFPESSTNAEAMCFGAMATSSMMMAKLKTSAGVP